MKRPLWIVAYIVACVATNAAFASLPLVTVLGVTVPPACLLAGLVFVVRDYAHRAAPSLVLPAMALGCVLSIVASSPRIAVASGIAFAISELTDYCVFRFSAGGFRMRILLSSVVAVPVDTALFLVAAFGSFPFPTFAAMVLGKLLAAACIAALAR